MPPHAPVIIATLFSSSAVMVFEFCRHASLPFPGVTAAVIDANRPVRASGSW
ncbi:hypothetical protein I551_8564 [Mycobacterium ulcerans str. Harvey]|uniref:Uncharacterized protein n=1 Tax=Mycobacterium ulcerans str. Harvey TaxID=1299332 RepID=A0ABN0RAI6_MYCUL|nr:hypothetical protein I551_8564 [Mycobacterium ulcerans str. Harvey]